MSYYTFHFVYVQPGRYASISARVVHRRGKITGKGLGSSLDDLTVMLQVYTDMKSLPLGFLCLLLSKLVGVLLIGASYVCNHTRRVSWYRLRIRSHQTSSHPHILTRTPSQIAATIAHVSSYPLSYPTHLFLQRHKQPIPDIPQSRLDHALLIHILITSPNPNLHTLLPLLARLP
jgi:hypothetical protein